MMIFMILIEFNGADVQNRTLERDIKRRFIKPLRLTVVQPY